MPRLRRDNLRVLGTLWYLPDGIEFDRAKSQWHKVWLNPEPFQVQGRKYFRLNETKTVSDSYWGSLEQMITEGRERCQIQVKYPADLYSWRSSRRKEIDKFVNQHQWFCEDGRFLTDDDFRAETGAGPSPSS